MWLGPAWDRKVKGETQSEAYNYKSTRNTLTFFTHPAHVITCSLKMVINFLIYTWSMFWLLLLSLGTSLDLQNLNPLLAAPDLSHWMSSWSFPSSSLLWTAGWTPLESSETPAEREGTSSSCKHTGALVKFKAWLKQAFIMTPEALKLQGWPAEELDRQEPGITTERSVLSAAGPNRFVDLGDVGCDVLHARVVKAVYPQTWVSALHLALEIVEGPCCMLQGE